MKRGIFFFCVPERIVNRTMKYFSVYVLRIAILFNFLILLVFAYQKNERCFTAKLAEQAHLFDILVSETHDVYVLLSRTKEHPIYVSSNVSSLLGQETVLIDTTKSVVRFKDVLPSGEQSSLIASFNKELDSWDNKTPFVSSRSEER